MGYSTLTFQTDGDIATITLTRPEKRNAISSQMISDLLAALDQAEACSQVVILTGSGKAFCAGMDLDELRSLAATHSPAKDLKDARRIAKMFYRLYTFPKPVIAAVNGAAIAGGCGLATLPDITLSVPEANFGYTEVRIGFVPALVAVFLRRQVSEKLARELLLTGKIIDAGEAMRTGLVNEIVANGDVMQRAHEIAEAILKCSPSSVIQTKKLFHEHADKALRAELELAIEANAEIRSTDDFREGLTAFLEKRTPRWSGSS